MPTLILYAVLAVAALGILGGITYKVRQGGYDACKVEWSQAAAEQSKREQELSAFAAKALADERKKRKVVIVEREKIVEKNIEKLVDSGQCFKPAGVSCVNGSIDGKGSIGCDADRAMPAARPPG